MRRRPTIDRKKLQTSWGTKRRHGGKVLQGGKLPRAGGKQPARLKNYPDQRKTGERPDADVELGRGHVSSSQPTLKGIKNTRRTPSREKTKKSTGTGTREQKGLPWVLRKGILTRKEAETCSTFLKRTEDHRFLKSSFTLNKPTVNHPRWGKSRKAWEYNYLSGGGRRTLSQNL